MLLPLSMATQAGGSCRDHLDVMFPTKEAGLPWDHSGTYSRSRLELWYLSHAAAPLTSSQLTEVGSHTTWSCCKRRRSCPFPDRAAMQVVVAGHSCDEFVWDLSVGAGRFIGSAPCAAWSWGGS